MTPHSHPEYVDGCPRCELSRDETLADMDAFIVTFMHRGRSYNVWIWPESATAEVNVRDGGSWTPIQLDDGIVEKLEVQGSLFNG